MIRRLDVPRECGSAGEMRAMQLLAAEPCALGVEPRFQHFQDWWVEPMDAYRVTIGRRIPIRPAKSLAFQTGFDWMHKEWLEVEVSGVLAFREGSQPAAGESFIAVRNGFSPAEAVVLGAADDAAGCALLVEAAKWFKAHPPDGMVLLVWFTGEELDRRGSRRFVSEHGLGPETVRLFVNIDGGFEQGTGECSVYVSQESVAEWTRRHLDTGALATRVRSVASSDAEAFYRTGIPTFWVTGPGRQPAHLPTYRAETIDEDKLELIGRLSIQATACAAQVGVERVALAKHDGG